MYLFDRLSQPLGPSRLVDLLRGYWLRPGGELSIGVIRIAIFAALLHTHWLNFGSVEALLAFQQSFSTANYIPKGILKLLGVLPFSVGFMIAVWWTGTVAGVFAILGLVTRPAMVAATIATLILCSFKESFGPYWSHPYNVVLLTALVFMLGPAGASLSLDRVIGRFANAWPFGRQQDSRPLYWPVLAAQLMVAFFYFGAFWAKLANGGIHWAIGDNMRWMVGITWRHPYADHETTAFIRSLLENKWYWQGAALLHLATQFLPILAVFQLHRPGLRILEAAVYASGVFGLYHVMTVWNPQWLWLTAVFVDWEWVAAKLRVAKVLDLRFLTPSTFKPDMHGGSLPPDSGPRRLPAADGYALVSVAAALGYCAYTFMFQTAHKHLNYPFSSFDFYSTVYAIPPYDQHRHLTYMGGAVRFRTDCGNVKAPVGSLGPMMTCIADQTEFERRARPYSTLFEAYRQTSPDGIVRALDGIRGYMDRTLPGAVPSTARIDLLVRLWQYPPYPAPAQPAVSHEALRGVRLPDGRTLSATGEAVVRGDLDRSIRVTVSGFRDPIIKFRYAHNPWYSFGRPDLLDLPGEWSSAAEFKLEIDAMKLPAFTTIIVKERSDHEQFEFWGPIFYPWDKKSIRRSQR